LNYNRPLGIHLRLTDTLYNVIRKAEAFDINAVQFFLTKLPTGKYINLNHENIDGFLCIKNRSFSHMYIHCSYWIHLTTENKYSLSTSIKLLKKEIRMAKKLQIQYLVLHAGSAKEQKKITAIETLARILNKVLKTERHITILLENTAHGGKTIGSDLQDFSILKTKIDLSEKIKFCLDLAHGFSYGYNLENTKNFINTIDTHMGIENIELLHVNDSAEQQGSKLDKHAIIGQGYIGQNTLQNIFNHEKLQHIPIILELPPVEHNIVKKTIEKTRKILSISNNKKSPKITPIQI
jgi:deoxyribonuclease-4